GQWLDEPALLSEARSAAALITVDHLAADTSLDIIGGAAGACLGLLAFHQVCPDETVRQQALACGDHLLSYRSTSATGHRAWANRHGQFLTGFAHGAAGIAYALLRLYEATREARFLEVAEEGIAYEDSVYSSQAGNWPDFRHAQPAFKLGWCHGAP